MKIALVLVLSLLFSFSSFGQARGARSNRTSSNMQSGGGNPSDKPIISQTRLLNKVRTDLIAADNFPSIRSFFKNSACKGEAFASLAKNKPAYVNCAFLKARDIIIPVDEFIAKCPVSIRSLADAVNCFQPKYNKPVKSNCIEKLKVNEIKRQYEICKKNSNLEDIRGQLEQNAENYINDSHIERSEDEFNGKGSCAKIALDSFKEDVAPKIKACVLNEVLEKIKTTDRLKEICKRHETLSQARNCLREYIKETIIPKCVLKEGREINKIKKDLYTCLEGQNEVAEYARDQQECVDISNEIEQSIINLENNFQARDKIKKTIVSHIYAIKQELERYNSKVSDIDNISAALEERVNNYNNDQCVPELTYLYEGRLGDLLNGTNRSAAPLAASAVANKNLASSSVNICTILEGVAGNEARINTKNAAKLSKIKVTHKNKAKEAIKKQEKMIKLNNKLGSPKGAIFK